tara:strand:- start:11 stop:475 length:465 start_codon:yes stop_codon:yes gene_type:complete
MTDKLPGKLTVEKLEAMTAKERENLWINARAANTPEAAYLVTVIESLGLPYSEDGGMRLDSPVAIKMNDIITSPGGKKSCLEATKNGLPALAGVDGELNSVLGVDYRAGNQATQTAGYLVGNLMISLGYKIAGQRKMPEGSVAKTAAFWAERKN